MEKQNIFYFYKQLLLKSLVAAMFLALTTGIQASAFENIDAGYYMWRLINELRARPADVVKRYDIDMDTAREALGTNSWIFDLADGLPPLAWNDLLALSSTDHIDDMEAEMYYGYTSPDDRSYEDRISATGYEAASTGESLGLLSFNVYLDPLEAVDRIFENMLRDELNPALNDPKNIFSISHTEIGIALKSAIFMFQEGQPFNAYVITADFAQPLEPRYFILGNFYDINSPDLWTDNGDDRVCLVDSDVKALVVPEHGWLHEAAVSGIFLFANYYLAGEPVFNVNVPVGTFAGYQIQVPSQGFFVLRVSDQITGFILQRAGTGMNVNQLIDLGIDNDSLQ